MMNESEKILFCYGKDNLTLTEALHHCGDIFADAIALLYSINSCKFAKVNSDNFLINIKNEVIPTDSFAPEYIFEARIFNSDCELRWLHEHNGKGRSALIFEQIDLQKRISQIWRNNDHLQYLESLDRQYLLWGQKNNKVTSEGWQKISSARVGTLSIPLEQEVVKNKRVYLGTKEYLKEIDTSCNVAVMEERLVRLELK